MLREIADLLGLLVEDPHLIFDSAVAEPVPGNFRRRAYAWCANWQNSCARGEIATVFVTHDLAEASILCDRCAILGTILQDEPVPTLLRRPRTPRVAEIVGIENVTQQGL